MIGFMDIQGKDITESFKNDNRFAELLNQMYLYSSCIKDKVDNEEQKNTSNEKIKESKTTYSEKPKTIKTTTTSTSTTGLKNNQVVSHPNYYQGKRECIEEMRLMFGDEAVKNFCVCSAYKYKFRAGKKDDNSKEQDLAKAEWYLSYVENM